MLRLSVVEIGIAGVVFNGVLLPSWYVMLHKVWPVESSRTIAYKIACNCFAWGFIGNGYVRKHFCLYLGSIIFILEELAVTD